MLDAFIIDQLKKKEEQERLKWEPLPLHIPLTEEEDTYEKKEDRRPLRRDVSF